jgi:YesN/AraC family two-component response regulator
LYAPARKFVKRRQSLSRGDCHRFIAVPERGSVAAVVEGPVVSTSSTTACKVNAVALKPQLTVNVWITGAVMPLVIRYIAQHYAEKLTVRRMAAMTGLNSVYFGALFKRETGLSMEQYLIRTRVWNAENLLRSGEYTVASVAEHCGYTNVFHFSKQYIPKKSARA